MTITETPTITIEVYSDVVCPWCYIGKRRFEAGMALAEAEDLGVKFKVSYRPFQLDPTAAPGVAGPVIEAYARKFGGMEQAEQILARVTSAAADEGLEFNMDRALRANTLLAHRLLWLADQPDSPVDQEILKERLLKAYFTDGVHIGDADALAECAAEVGFDRAEIEQFLDSDRGVSEVQAELEEASTSGITAVPTYVLNGQWAIPGPRTLRPLRRCYARWQPKQQRVSDLSDASLSRGRLVFAHGFTQTARSWSHFEGLLKPVLPGIETLAVDLPGHGSATDLRCDLLASAEYLVDQGGRATYVGYSMGGRVALHAALARPGSVEALALIGATAGLDSASDRQQRRDADELLATRIESIGVSAFIDEWLANPLFAGLSDDQALRSDRLRNTSEGLAASLRSTGTGTQEPLWDRLAEIDVPVLVIAGEKDDKFRVIGERLADRLPQSTFEIIPNSGHSAHLEQPAATAEVLSDWYIDSVGR